MIRIKPGVRLAGLRPEILLAIPVAEGIWMKLGATEMVITGGVEGKHKRESAHYTGRAIDIRTHNLGAPEVRRAACAELQERLGPDYDVVFENENTPTEHAHAEWDPKEQLAA